MTDKLRKENAEPAASFVVSPIWSDIRRVMMLRRPAAPAPEDLPHVAAAKGLRRAAFEKALDAIEKLPFETVEEQADPFDRPAITNTED